MLIDVCGVKHEVLALALGRVLRRHFDHLPTDPDVKLEVVREILDRRNELMPLLRVGRSVKEAWPKTKASVGIDFQNIRTLQDYRLDDPPTWHAQKVRDESLFVLILTHPPGWRDSFFGKVRHEAASQNCHTARMPGLGKVDKIGVISKWSLSWKRD